MIKSYIVQFIAYIWPKLILWLQKTDTHADDLQRRRRRAQRGMKARRR